MANDVSYLKIIGVNERRQESGELRITAAVEEILPRRHNINLSQQPADYINSIRAMAGKTVLLQTREGVFQDRAFLAINGPLVLPIDASSVSQLAETVQPSEELPDHPSPTGDKAAAPMFGRKTA